LGRLRNRQPRKVAELDQLGGRRVGGGQLGQGLVECQQVLADFWRGDLFGVEILALGRRRIGKWKDEGRAVL
jgi:hypothetical protein